jgi:hypothetical protein
MINIFTATPTQETPIGLNETIKHELILSQKVSQIASHNMKEKQGTTCITIQVSTTPLCTEQGRMHSKHNK